MPVTYHIPRETSSEVYTSVILDLYNEKKIFKGTHLWLKDISPLLRTQWKLWQTPPPDFPWARHTTPSGTLFFIRRGSSAWALWWYSLDKGGKRSTRQAEQQGRYSYTGGGDSNSNADSKKAGGTNKSLLNPLPTNAESWLSQSLKPQIAILNLPKFLKF